MCHRWINGPVFGCFVAIRLVLSLMPQHGWSHELPAEEESSWSELRYPSLLLSGVLHPEPREALRRPCAKDGDNLPSSLESKSLLCLKGRRVSRYELDDLWLSPTINLGVSKLFLTKFSFSSASSYSLSLPGSLSFLVAVGSTILKHIIRGGTGMGTGLPVLPLNPRRWGVKKLVRPAVCPSPWGFTPPGSDTMLRCLSPPWSRRCGFRTFTGMEHVAGSALKFSSLPPTLSGSLPCRRAIVVCR